MKEAYVFCRVSHFISESTLNTMSLIESKVDKLSEYIETSYSSGDSNGMKYSHNKQFYQEENNNSYKKQDGCQHNPYEENNNVIDEITKDFSEMGCIVDAVKRPPNICVETCVYEESDSDDEEDRSHRSQNNEEEVHYSDEFEEADLSDVELDKNASKSVVSNANSKTQLNKTLSKSSVKQTKSQSSMSQCASQKPGSVSGRSTDYGSVSVPQTRRINMSFTNDRLRDIERHNHILLNKILSARNKRKSSIPLPRDEHSKKPMPPAAMQRRNQQRKIDHDNMILLKKIQRAKSSACSIRR